MWTIHGVRKNDLIEIIYNASLTIKTGESTLFRSTAKRQKKNQLEIWDKAQRESAWRRKCDWGEIQGAEIPR